MEQMYRIFVNVCFEKILSATVSFVQMHRHDGHVPDPTLSPTRVRICNHFVLTRMCGLIVYQYFSLSGDAASILMEAVCGGHWGNEV